MLGGEEGITFESIHGGDTALIRAADLDLDRFIPRGSGAAAPIPAAELPAAPTAVLLTGANGFLGRFLLLELLQRVARQCAHIHRFRFRFLRPLPAAGAPAARGAAVRSHTHVERIYVDSSNMCYVLLYLAPCMCSI